MAAAAPSEKAPMTPVEKELVFEKENQAVLSSDQTSILIKWWNGIDATTKIKRREVYIEITGFTSTTGSNNYNYELGKDRARDVGKKLSGIIGESLSGEPVAEIRVNSFGEDTEDPRKYVKIYISDK